MVDFKSMLKPIDFTRKRPDEVPTPHTTKSANRRLAALREARGILTTMPGPGEALHAIMSGRYDLTDVIEAILERVGAVAHLRIATLSFNR